MKNFKNFEIIQKIMKSKSNPINVFYPESTSNGTANVEKYKNISIFYGSF